MRRLVGHHDCVRRADRQRRLRGDELSGGASGVGGARAGTGGAVGSGGSTGAGGADAVVVVAARDRAAPDTGSIVDAAGPPQTEVTDGGTWKLVWSDEFDTDGAPNPLLALMALAVTVLVVVV